MENKTVTMAHGAGGRQTSELIDEVFKAHFANPDLTADDAAVLVPPAGKMAVSTDGFIVSPAFFSGGNIGKLSICGTVNDLACMGARPLYLTCAFVIEEGFPMEKLEKIASAMEKTAKEAAEKELSDAGKRSLKDISYKDYDSIYQSSIHNGGKNKVMLGKYDGGGSTSYITKAGDEYTYFSLGKEWDSIKSKYGYTDDEMFKLFNEAFLDDGINAKKTFYFSHNPQNAKGALKDEYQYLLKNNYKWDSKTMTMRP